jgi:hypothetical protein
VNGLETVAFTLGTLGLLGVLVLGAFVLTAHLDDNDTRPMPGGDFEGGE